MTQHYIGTKIITAWAQERDGQPGYAVKYEDGYISWSPKEVFEKAYLPMGHVGALPTDLQELRGQIVYNRDRVARLRYMVEQKPDSLAPGQAELMRAEVAMLEHLLTVQEERFDHQVIINGFDGDNNPCFVTLKQESQSTGFNNGGVKDNS